MELLVGLVVLLLLAGYQVVGATVLGSVEWLVLVLRRTGLNIEDVLVALLADIDISHI